MATCFGNGLGRDPLDLRRPRGLGGDEGPKAVHGLDEAIRLKPAIDGPRSIGVDARIGRHLANARQPVSGRQLAGGDHRPEAPGDLDPDGKVAGAVHAEEGLSVHESDSNRELVN